MLCNSNFPDTCEFKYFWYIKTSDLNICFLEIRAIELSRQSNEEKSDWTVLFWLECALSLGMKELFLPFQHPKHPQNVLLQWNLSHTRISFLSLKHWFLQLHCKKRWPWQTPTHQYHGCSDPHFSAPRLSSNSGYGSKAPGASGDLKNLLIFPWLAAALSTCRSDWAMSWEPALTKQFSPNKQFPEYYKLKNQSHVCHCAKFTDVISSYRL